MENNITKIKIFPTYDELYQEYLNKTVENMKKYAEINLSAKLLHYLNKPTFYYYCIIYKNTNINPFDTNILFCIEFIDSEIPYVTILTNFIEPTLNDNRNYYKCLSNEYKYKFSINDFKELEIILESIIQGIQYFLHIIKESISINAFIFFGEYEYNHIYQINDFLQSKNCLNLYRINELINNDITKEKYIIFTKLYFLLFEPLEKDKALIKLIFHKKLKDLDISLERNEINNSLILKFLSKELINDLEFIIIDRTRIVENKIKPKYKKQKNNNHKLILKDKIKENHLNKIIINNNNQENEEKKINKNNDSIQENEEKAIKIYKNNIKENEVSKIIEKNSKIHENEEKIMNVCNDNNKEKEIDEIIKNNNNIQQNEDKKINKYNNIIENEVSKIIKNNELKVENSNKKVLIDKFENNTKIKTNSIIINNSVKETEVKKEKINYSKIIIEWFVYLDNIKFHQYDLIINNYTIIFNKYKTKLKLKKKKKSLIKECNNLIEFYEKLIEFYENKNNNNNKERIHKIISEIIYISSELISYSKNKNNKENEYLLKIQKCLKSYK